MGGIPALYIVIVPLLGLAFRKKAPFTALIAVVVSVVGLYFLCVSGRFTIAVINLALLLCAFVFSCQILAVDHFSQKVDGVSLSFVQSLVVTLCSSVGSLFFETPSLEPVLSCIGPIFYVGIFSSGVAYTLRIIAQKDSNPTVISLLLSLEAFFSVVAGALLLREVLTVREYFGCVLMLAAVVVAQLPVPKRKTV